MGYKLHKARVILGRIVVTAARKYQTKKSGIISKMNLFS